MYNFHYNYMKPKYGDEVMLLYTDTDSYIYEIETDDFYRDIGGDVETWFDTSEFESPFGNSNSLDRQSATTFFRPSLYLKVTLYDCRDNNHLISLILHSWC